MAESSSGDARDDDANETGGDARDDANETLPSFDVRKKIPTPPAVEVDDQGRTEAAEWDDLDEAMYSAGLSASKRMAFLDARERQRLQSVIEAQRSEIQSHHSRIEGLLEDRERLTEQVGQWKSIASRDDEDD